MEVIEEENKEEGADLADCTCFSQQGRKKCGMTFHSVDDQCTDYDDEISADNSRCQPERNQVRRV